MFLHKDVCNQAPVTMTLRPTHNSTYSTQCAESGYSSYRALYSHRIHRLPTHLTGEPKTSRALQEKHKPANWCETAKAGTHFVQQQKQGGTPLSAVGPAALLWTFSVALIHHSGGLHPRRKGQYRNPFRASAPDSIKKMEFITCFNKQIQGEFCRWALGGQTIKSKEHRDPHSRHLQISQQWTFLVVLGREMRQFRLFRYLLQQHAPWSPPILLNTTKELIPWFWSGTQKLSKCPPFQVLSFPSRTAAIKRGKKRKLLGTKDEKSARPYHRLPDSQDQRCEWNQKGTYCLE